MNRKIKKYNEEIIRTEKKISELQAYLKGIRCALKEVENEEIIKSIRGMKLNNKELVEMLEKIQDGTLTLQVEEPESDKEDGSFTFQKELMEEKEKSEENSDDEQKGI